MPADNVDGSGAGCRGCGAAVVLHCGSLLWGCSRFFPVGGIMVLLVLVPLIGCAGSGDDAVREPLVVIGCRGRSPGRFLKPRAIAANGWDEIFVVDRSGRIQKFDRNGRYLFTWELDTVEKGYPTGLGCDGAGDLWVADTHNSRILHYSRSGELLSTLGEYGEEPGRLVYPTDVLVRDDGTVLVTDYGGLGRDRIVVFRRDGSFVAEWGGTGSEPGKFQRAMALCSDPDGNIWVADSCNHRLQCLSPRGECLRVIGGGGAAEAVLRYPYDVTVESNGNLLVCEFGGHRVQTVTREGVPVSTWGRPGTAPGEFHDPWGICVLGDHVFVVDALNHRIQIFGA